MGQRSAARASLLGHIGSGPMRRQRPQPEQPAPAEAQRQAEIEQELLLARDIQQGLLLEAVPQLPGWEISAVSLPARDLGGDLYDFLSFDGHIHGIMIGDVSGKGLPAALRMAVARTVFRHEARKGMKPGVTLAEVNRGVLADIPQGMVTMLYTLLDLETGSLRIANAGHNFPIVIDGTLREVELTGLPLGVDAESDYREEAYQLHHGDTVFFFTDGVVEAMNHSGEMYGDDRLQRVLAETAGQRPRAIVARLLQELRQWSENMQADDITLVVVRRRCARLGEELRLVIKDVLGHERGGEFIAQLPWPSDDTPAKGWAEIIPDLVRRTQAQFGRGLARELHGQMRLVLEEYK
ncbi:serine/threonine-protein phosphatase [Chloroflexia bacterium SDU3-3]|nr:serine/threonine-protein phosphatase [Chloroflexia bacterium SDU3-3]